jgi:hypothetical protein
MEPLDGSLDGADIKKRETDQNRGGKKERPIKIER